MKSICSGLQLFNTTHRLLLENFSTHQCVITKSYSSFISQKGLEAKYSCLKCSVMTSIRQRPMFASYFSQIKKHLHSESKTSNSPSSTTQQSFTDLCDYDANIDRKIDANQSNQNQSIDIGQSSVVDPAKTNTTKPDSEIESMFSDPAHSFRGLICRDCSQRCYGCGPGEIGAPENSDRYYQTGGKSTPQINPNNPLSGLRRPSFPFLLAMFLVFAIITLSVSVSQHTFTKKKR